jgi:co-chaperonin GroES (HSP10)
MPDIAVDQTIESIESRAKQLPEPTGYRVLCAVPNVQKTFGSKLVKADETVRVEEQTTIVLYVVKLGPDAYKDLIKFPSGPWCKEGDFVITRAYAGTRITIHGKEFRVINDDSVEAVVENPIGIGRAG